MGRLLKSRDAVVLMLQGWMQFYIHMGGFLIVFMASSAS